MVQRYVVMTSAWLEIVVGAIFAIAPNFPCELVFGERPENIGGPLARWVGISLFALGIACLPRSASGTPRSVLTGLSLFNAGVAILFVCVGLASVHGPLLWPAAIVHALIAAALLDQLLTRNALWRMASLLHQATSWGRHE